ncbi:MAG: NusG domain II-containing protein [Clostridiales Family XIII bacterium]|nr:NusG domain II-containing protein [Clostridiales Family XIII bacterium]
MKRLDAILIALLLAVALVAMAFLSATREAPGAGALYAEVYEDGVLTRTLPLSADSDTLVTTSRGYNRIVVADGGVCVSEADCASQTCVHSGIRRLPGDSIACLPHRLIIRIRGGDAPYDAIAHRKPAPEAGAPHGLTRGRSPDPAGSASRKVRPHSRRGCRSRRLRGGRV